MSNVAPVWRSTPPGIFPVCLGLLGLGLGWRSASEILPISQDIGNVLLGFSCAYYLYFLACYLRKLIARPGALIEDTTKPPARAGIAAAAMSMLLFAAALLAFDMPVPLVWWIGVLAQVGVGAHTIYAIWRDPPGNRQISTFQYLGFVGIIVAPGAGVRLGYVSESMIMTLVALTTWAIISVGLLWQFRHTRPPVPLRPSMAIILAPFCMFAVSFGLLEVTWAFTWFYWASLAVAAVLALMVPWMIKGGWSPVWASFTFPLAAFVQMQVMAVSNFGTGAAIIGAYAAMAIATPIILIVAYRITRMYIEGSLAVKTGAAQA